MSEKPAKPAKSHSKPTVSRKPTAKPPEPSHEEISVHAYFIYLDEGRPDELENWLRAECELTTT